MAVPAATAVAIIYKVSLRLRARSRAVADAQAAIDELDLSGKVKPFVLAEANVHDGKAFPLALKPATKGYRRAFFLEHKSLLHQCIRMHGAVLLRGWADQATAADFAEVSRVTE